MCIVINNGNACNLSLVLETAVCSCKAAKTFDNDFFGKTKKMSQSDRSQSIGYIVDARYFQVVASHFDTVTQCSKGSVAVFIIGNISSLIISIMFQTIGNYLAWKIADDVFILRCICIDDQCSVSRKKFCEAAERMTDVIDIFKEVKMVCIHIQDHTDLREKT